MRKELKLLLPNGHTVVHDEVVVIGEEEEAGPLVWFGYNIY